MRLAAALAAVLCVAGCNCGRSDPPDAGTAGGSTAGGATAGGSTAGGATAGGSTAGGSTAGGSAGGVAGGAGNPLLPRLVVASRGASGGGTYSVRVWNTANQLTSDTPAPVVLAGVDAPAAALAASSTSLFVVHETSTAGAPVLQRWADPRTLGTGAAPAVRINAGTFGSLAGVDKVQLDDIGSLWILRSPGEVLRIDNVATATAGAGFDARYTHPFDQIFGFAFEQTNNRLFAGQVSGAGILAWSQANAKTGDAGTHTFQLSADPVATMDIGANRLFASFFQKEVKVWLMIGAASMPRAFDFELATDAGVSASIRDVRVCNDHLVVTLQPTPTTGRVLIYRDMSNLFAAKQPEVVIEHASLQGPKRAVLGRDGTLYVLDPNGISIFGDALGTPVFKTELTDVSVAADLLLLE